MHDESSAIVINAMTQQDLPAAFQIQTKAYPAFLVEDEDILLSRINLTASYCLSAKRGEVLLGYLIAHGWNRQSPPPVGTALIDGEKSEVLFIHDLSISPEQRGLGIGESLIARAFELAARSGLRSAELIAVEGAANYWRRLGFSQGEVSPELLEKLGSYGTRARWMTRSIPQGH